MLLSSARPMAARPAFQILLALLARDSRVAREGESMKLLPLSLLAAHNHSKLSSG